MNDNKIFINSLLLYFINNKISKNLLLILHKKINEKK